MGSGAPFQPPPAHTEALLAACPQVGPSDATPGSSKSLPSRTAARGNGRASLKKYQYVHTLMGTAARGAPGVELCEALRDQAAPGEPQPFVSTASCVSH